MAPTYTIPIEIQHEIINIFAKSEPDLSSIKACSLACHAFLPLCRRRIFRSIALNAWTKDGPHPTTCKLQRLLSTTPEISSYIRDLDYRITKDDLNNPSIDECLKKISRLQSLSVSCYPDRRRFITLDWANNRLRPTLLHLLHLPTLTCFKSFQINNFVLSDLVPCLSLKNLGFGFHIHLTKDDWPAYGHPLRLEEYLTGTENASTTKKICNTQYPNRQPLIDFPNLPSIKMVIHQQEDSRAAQELFKHCENLVNVRITFTDPNRVFPSISCMLRPSMHTLKGICIQLAISADRNPHVLPALFSELEDIRGHANVIESITLVIRLDVDEESTRWSDLHALDPVFARPGWSALKRVTLDIWIGDWYSEHRDLEESLREGKERYFPSLSKSDNVEFVLDFGGEFENSFA